MKHKLGAIAAFSACVLTGSAAAQIERLGEGVEFASAERTPVQRRALTLSLDSSWSENTILGGAHAAGMFGAFFKTDLYLMAPCVGSSGVVVFDLWSLPNGTSGNGTLKSLRYSIPAGGFGIIQDVVGEFGQTGGSTLFLKVVSSSSTVTSSCRELSSWAKTYTASPTGGSYSTGLVSTFGNTISYSNNYEYGAVTGVVQNANYRTNVIIYTPYSSSGTVRLYVFNENGQNIGTKDVFVNGYSATQVSLSEFSIGEPGGSIRLMQVSSIYVEAAVVTVDNQTNDGFFRHFTIHNF